MLKITPVSVERVKISFHSCQCCKSLLPVLKITPAKGENKFSTLSVLKINSVKGEINPVSVEGKMVEIFQVQRSSYRVSSQK